MDPQLTASELADLVECFSPQTLDALALTYFGISHHEWQEMRRKNMNIPVWYKIDLLMYLRDKMRVQCNFRLVRKTRSLPCNLHSELFGKENVGEVCCVSFVNGPHLGCFSGVVPDRPQSRL